MKKEMDIVYGRARPEDLPAVVELCMLVEEQHEQYWPLRWQRRAGLAEGYMAWMSKRLEDPRMLIEVARDAGIEAAAGVGKGVVGMIVVTIAKEVPIYTYDEYAYIQDMAVRESHRRLGIAQRLLAEAAAWTKGHGLGQLRLMVAEQNPGARAAFERAGFLPTYQEMVLPVEEGGGK
jgi:GNAT superfamily N-acetyltransferase